jgi:hypothetical protein
MIELKKLNVHRIVESEEAAARLMADGFSVVNKAAKKENIPKPQRQKPKKA